MENLKQLRKETIKKLSPSAIGFFRARGVEYSVHDDLTELIEAYSLNRACKQSFHYLVEWSHDNADYVEMAQDMGYVDEKFTLRDLLVSAYRAKMVKVLQAQLYYIKKYYIINELITIIELVLVNPKLKVNENEIEQCIETACDFNTLDECYSVARDLILE